jgi:hypothetical protein
VPNHLVTDSRNTAGSRSPAITTIARSGRYQRPWNARTEAWPAVFRESVTKWFGTWKGKGKATPAPSFGDPVAPAGGAGAVGETKVLVEPDLPRTFNYTILRPWRQVTDNIAYNQGLMTDALAQAIINRRLEARAAAICSPRSSRTISAARSMRLRFRSPRWARTGARR